MLTLFELVASLLTITAIFAWFNHRFLKLPANIGLLIMGMTASLVLIGIDFLFPDTPLYEALIQTLRQIDFYDAVMNGMLAFLLFAGALHVDFTSLRNRAPVIAILATVGVFISMLIVATGLWGIGLLLGLPISFAWALVFGALISPTDPVAVLSTLKAANVPQTLETDMSGESLFNDGVGVVLFAITLQAALGSNGDFGFLHATELLLVEAGGGAVLGLITGYIIYRAMRAIDDYSIEVLLSIALVAGTYALASKLHLSGPIAVVVAGVLIGNRGTMDAMSEVTQRYVFGFWTLIDDVLNAVLFLLIGLEIVLIGFEPFFIWIALLTIPLVLFARLVAVGIPVTVLERWQHFVRGTIPVLAWGGIRGGISVALALSLPDSPERPYILTATYAVVLFSIIIQGLTLEGVVRKCAGKPKQASSGQ